MNWQSMDWPALAGVAQVALIIAFLVIQFRARRPAGETIVAAVAMGALAAGTLVAADWALVVAGVFYAIWLLDQVFHWIRPSIPIRPTPDGDPARRPTRARTTSRLDHGLLAGIGVVVLALTWFAVSAANVPGLS
jgi:hypothetical protein